MRWEMMGQHGFGCGMKARAFLRISFGGSKLAVLEAGIGSALAESAAMDGSLNHPASGPIPGAL